MTSLEKIKYKAMFTLLVYLSSCSISEKKENADSHKMESGMIMISDRDKLLSNIKTETAKLKSISETTTLVGKAIVDDRKVEVLTSRVEGRVDQLYVKNPGEFVKQGQAVYAIYSEELLADENDYLFARDQYEKATTQKHVAKELAEGARKKLLSWTLNDNQIKELERSRKVSNLIIFYNPYDGYVTELTLREGAYVQIGTPLLKLANLNDLWVETQIYSGEIKYLEQNPSLLVEFEAYPGEQYDAEIVFDNPMIEQDRKVNLIKVHVHNRDHKLKPGMMAYVYLERNRKTALVIPKSALLVESSVSVWIETDGMFEQRMVNTGIENKKEVEILSGIQPGEKVVVSGAFFLKSESVIRQGNGGMAGMKM